MKQAIAQAQESLSPNKTSETDERTCFPAQLIHCLCDRPQTAATLIIDNDFGVSNPDE
ncbi:hypothetical protein [Synechococcus elongatus]|nr:hypothetical protein [Synechococcus elongatus]MBD2588758.1 hypothetical protein [Synechococcus elongatus FACHB-242]MBD2689654.1 hypothetical protein [Synechococcus elongatus FACHB-1061]MBD2708260.1 hypothetical protein [Synechococcus elongatus PCC 7942 = FACHB-805]UOW70656.1 hypothetical protein PCC7943_0895 [Synechococcus elongatus PCC 7943]UOW73377.1 hypothetical protein PCC6311_0895 [Synechococcus elongatus PCC 6311]